MCLVLYKWERQKPFEAVPSSTKAAGVSWGCWRVGGMLEGPGDAGRAGACAGTAEMGSVAGRDGVLGGSSAKRSSRNKTHEPFSGTASRDPGGVRLSRLLHTVPRWTSQQPFKSDKICSEY